MADIPAEEGFGVEEEDDEDGLEFGAAAAAGVAVAVWAAPFFLDLDFVFVGT